MFGDYSWDSSRSDRQMSRFRQWMERQRRIVAIEMGAGLAIPTVRNVCEQLGDPLIRINPREPEVTGRSIGIAMGARAALEQIDVLII